MTADKPLPNPGSRIRCINNTDRPLLVVGQEYVVAYDVDVANGGKGLPIFDKQFYPTDYRYIAIRMPDNKNDIYPFGLFEVVKLV